MVNNFTENLLKAYMVGGVENALKVGYQQGKGALRVDTGLTKDLLKLTDPRNAGPVALQFDTQLARIGQKYGVVVDDFFSEAFKHGSEQYLTSRVGIERAKKLIADRDKGAVGKVYSAYQNLLKETVGRTGSLIEQSARLTSFDHVAKNLIENADELAETGLKLSDTTKNFIKVNGLEAASKLPEVDAILKKAADIVNGAFFDYGNVTLFEQEVMKRIVPYWTFFRNNIPYWVENMTQGSKVDRAVGSLGLIKATGRKPTVEERSKIPDYLLSQGVRVGDRGKLNTFPSLSIIDAVNTANFRDTTLSKLHPLLGTLRSLVTGETSLGGPLLPSSSNSGKTKAQSPLLKAIVPDKLGGLVKDRMRGNDVYTTSDAYAVLELLKQNLLPAPIVDTVLRGVEDRKKGTSLQDILTNLGPVKTKKLRPDETRRTLNRRRTEARIERKKEIARGRD